MGHQRIRRAGRTALGSRLKVGAVLCLVLGPNGAEAAIGGGGGIIQIGSLSESILQNVTTQTVNIPTQSYSTRVLGVLIGRGAVFDQTISQSASTPLFDAAINAADHAVTVSGAPLFVRLLPPRLILSATTSTTSSATVDVVANPIPASADLNCLLTANRRGTPTMR